MKAIAISILSIAMFVSAVFAFAYSGSATTAKQSLQGYHQWIGKSAAQMIRAIGQPSYSSTDKNGSLTYDYVLEQQRAGPVVTYQFVIGSTKKVDTEKLSF